MKTRLVPIFRLALLASLLLSPLQHSFAAEAGSSMARWESAVTLYMTPQLRAQVDELRVAVARNATTTPQLLNTRKDILWDWANAYALSGRAINPNLPQEIARLNQAPISQRTVDQFGAILDWYVHEFSYRDAFPNGINRLEADYLGPFPADSFAELVQTYTVADAPIRVNGGFLIASRDHLGAFAFQTEDPAADNWLNVTSNNPSVEFDVTTLPLNGMFSGGGLGVQYFPRPYFRVSRGTLNPGDIVTITVGDQRWGSRGMKLPSASNSALRIRVWLSLETPQQLFSLNELPFYSEGLDTVALRGFGPSIAATGEKVLLSVRSEDQYRNRATGGFKPYFIYNGEEVLHLVTDSSQAYHEFDHLSFDVPGVYYLTARSLDRKLEGQFNPILVSDEPDDRIFWGETHGHTGFAEGAGTVDNFFEFAREDARLDFMTLSEHDLWMDDWEWEVIREKVIEADEPGRFLSYLGYEWTRPPNLGGHHNVLFRTAENRDRVEAQRAPQITDLYPLLKAENRIEDILVIPHAHNPGRWWQTDPEVEHLVEIVSNHGTFEWLGRAFLREGIHLGFVGGSDDHVGHPGIRPLNSERSGSDNFGGMAAVLAQSLDSDQLFDAMKTRRSYATNGQKIILQMTVNGAGMGQQIAHADTVHIEGRAIGTGAIAGIDLIKNGETLASNDYMHSSFPNSGKLEIRFNSTSDPQRRDARARGYRIWRGSLRLTGAELVDLSLANVENVYTEYATINEANSQEVQFFMRSRGAPRSIILDIGELTADATMELSIGVGGDNLLETLALEAAVADGILIQSPSEEFVDEINVRWIYQPVEQDRNFSFTDSQAEPGDSYYVRITQSNGGMAWSSPVKIQD